MDLTKELRAKAEENADDPEALLEILYDLTTWSDEDIAEMQQEILDKVSEHIDGEFPWPGTDVPTGDGKVDPEEWPGVGLLGKMGYKVGKSGKAKYTRRGILHRAFRADADDWLRIEEQADEWGKPQSEERLEKIANSLAAFARNAKRRDDPSLETAISHWGEDLQHLKKRFYKPRYDFDWPELGFTDNGGGKTHLPLPFEEE